MVDCIVIVNKTAITYRAELYTMPVGFILILISYFLQTGILNPSISEQSREQKL